MESPLLTALAAKGCEIEKSLEATFMGRESFYVRMLHKLPASPCVGKVRAAIEANSATQCFEASHELKGLYATLGLTPLYERCCEIVEITRKGSMEGVAEKLPPMAAMHDEYVALINQYN